MILFFQSSTKTVLAVEAARMLSLLKTLKNWFGCLARQLLFNQKHWKAGT